MRSNMIKVEIMPVSLIVILTMFAFICAFIGNYLIIKGINELNKTQDNINYVIQEEIKNNRSDKYEQRKYNSKIYR